MNRRGCDNFHTDAESLHSDGENDSEWTKVRLGGADGIIGWVHGGYLRLV